MMTTIKEEPEISSSEEFFSCETNSSSTEAIGCNEDGCYKSAESQIHWKDYSTDCDADQSSLDDSPRCSSNFGKYLQKKHSRNLKKIKHMFHILEENGTLATKPKYKPFEMCNNIIIACETKLHLSTGEFKLKREKLFLTNSRNTEYTIEANVNRINPNSLQFLHSVKNNMCIVINNIYPTQVLVNVCNIENETVQFICLGAEYDEMWEYWHVMNNLNATTVDEFCSNYNLSIITKRAVEIIDNRQLMFSYVEKNLSSEFLATSRLSEPAFKLFFDFVLKLDTQMYDWIILKYQLNQRSSSTETTPCIMFRSQQDVIYNNSNSSSMSECNVESRMTSQGLVQNIPSNGSTLQKHNDMSKTFDDTQIDLENMCVNNGNLNNVSTSGEQISTEETGIKSELSQLVAPEIMLRFGTSNILRLVSSEYSFEQATKLSEMFTSDWYQNFYSHVYHPSDQTNFLVPTSTASSNTSQLSTNSCNNSYVQTRDVQIQTPKIKKKASLRYDVSTETEDIISGNRYERSRTVFKYNHSFYCDGSEGKEFTQDVNKMPEYSLFGDGWNYQSLVFPLHFTATKMHNEEQTRQKKETQNHYPVAYWFNSPISEPKRDDHKQKLQNYYPHDHYRTDPKPSNNAFGDIYQNISNAPNFASTYLNEGNELFLNYSQYQHSQQLDPQIQPHNYLTEAANDYQYLGDQQCSFGGNQGSSINFLHNPIQGEEQVMENFTGDILNNAIIRNAHLLHSKVPVYDGTTKHSACEVPYLIINSLNLKCIILQLTQQDPSLDLVKQFLNVDMEYPMYFMHLPANLERMVRADLHMDNVQPEENQEDPNNTSGQLVLIPHPWFLVQIHPNHAVLAFWRSLRPPFYYNQIANRRLKKPFNFKQN